MSDNLQERYFGHEHLTVIAPTRGWRTLDLRELWAYRELLWVLAQRDVKVRYKQTFLGVAWAVIQPVTAMIIFTLVFGTFARLPSDGQPYPVFVYAALLPWTFFASAVGTASNSLLAATHIVNKVYFPRLLVPMSSVGAALVDFAVSMAVLLALMAYYGVAWTPHLLAVPGLIAVTVFTALGVGTLLAALNAAYRDFRYVIPVLLQLWMYATPVVYPASMVPERWRWLLDINPMAGLVQAFRAAFLGTPFDGPALTWSIAISMAIFVAGIAYFERLERGLTDML